MTFQPTKQKQSKEAKRVSFQLPDIVSNETKKEKSKHKRKHVEDKTFATMKFLQKKSSGLLKLYESVEDIQSQVLTKQKKKKSSNPVKLLQECSALEEKILKDLYANYNKKFYQLGCIIQAEQDTANAKALQISQHKEASKSLLLSGNILKLLDQTLQEQEKSDISQLDVTTKKRKKVDNNMMII